MLFRALLAALCAAILGSGSAAAQAPRAATALDTLSPVVVTATRVNVATAGSTASATVLRGDDLRAQGVSRVVDALRFVPGAAIVESGPVGSQASLFLRGGNSNYVRVLVDGVALNDAGGYFDFASLSTDNLDRIEIVRGPSSVLYGSDAVTGVIQLFTRDRIGPPGVNAAAGVGSYGTRRAELGVSGGSARAGFSLAGTHLATDGILAFNNRYANDVLSAMARFAPDARTDARVSARWSGTVYHFPTDYSGQVIDHNQEQSDHRLILSLDAGRRIGSRAELRVLLASNEYLPRANDAPDSPADTLGYYGFFSRSVRTNRSADARLNLRLEAHRVLTLGAEVERDRERSTSLSLSDYGPSSGSFEASRHNAGFYAQAAGDATPRVSFVVGARVDRNSEFGAFPTVRASAAWRISSNARARVSAGNAFKAPSFFENFSTGYVRGNPDLRPEQSRGAEAGVDAWLGQGRIALRATGFLQHFRDVIDYTGSAPSPGAPNYFNVAGADANGIELEAQYRGVERLTVSGSWTWTNTRVTEAGFDASASAAYVKGQPLIRRAPHAVTLGISRAFARGGSVELDGVRIGQRDDRDFTAYPVRAVTMPAYVKADVSAVIPAAARVPGGMAFVGRVDNLFGARYQEVAKYAAPGRTFFLGLRFGK